MMGLGCLHRPHAVLHIHSPPRCFKIANTRGGRTITSALRIKAEPPKRYHVEEEQELLRKPCLMKNERGRGEEEDEEEEKVEFLERLGVDSFAAMEKNPSIVSPETTVDSMEEVLVFLGEGFGVQREDMGRLVGLYPQLLTASVRDHLRPVCAFLLREARIPFGELPTVIRKKPPILVCSVGDRLRPTLSFLHSIGIRDLRKNYFLLPCSVESQLLPHLELFRHHLGFPEAHALNMFLRLPALFCYNIPHNILPKMDFLLHSMFRDPTEISEFPQYFAFSLENRIMPRHSFLSDRGICLPLPRMLIPSDNHFYHSFIDGGSVPPPSNCKKTPYQQK